jgi:hypothetical protein
VSPLRVSEITAPRAGQPCDDRHGGIVRDDSDASFIAPVVVEIAAEDFGASAVRGEQTGPGLFRFQVQTPKRSAPVRHLRPRVLRVQLTGINRLPIEDQIAAAVVVKKHRSARNGVSVAAMTDGIADNERPSARMVYELRRLIAVAGLEPFQNDDRSRAVRETPQRFLRAFEAIAGLNRGFAPDDASDVPANRQRVIDDVHAFRKVDRGFAAVKGFLHRRRAVRTVIAYGRNRSERPDIRPVLRIVPRHVRRVSDGQVPCGCAVSEQRDRLLGQKLCHLWPRSLPRGVRLRRIANRCVITLHRNVSSKQPSLSLRNRSAGAGRSAGENGIGQHKKPLLRLYRRNRVNAPQAANRQHLPPIVKSRDPLAGKVQTLEGVAVLADGTPHAVVEALDGQVAEQRGTGPVGDEREACVAAPLRVAGADGDVLDRPLIVVEIVNANRAGVAFPDFDRHMEERVAECLPVRRLRIHEVVIEGEDGTRVGRIVEAGRVVGKTQDDPFFAFALKDAPLELCTGERVADQINAVRKVDKAVVLLEDALQGGGIIRYPISLRSQVALHIQVTGIGGKDHTLSCLTVTASAGTGSDARKSDEGNKRQRQMTPRRETEKPADRRRGRVSNFRHTSSSGIIPVYIPNCCQRSGFRNSAILFLGCRTEAA